MSQEQLAGAIGVTRNTIYNLESESTKPRADTLYRIARVTGKPLDWFFQDPARPLSLFPTLMAAAIEGAATMQAKTPQEDELLPPAPAPRTAQPDRLECVERILERLDGRMERIEHALVDIAAELRQQGSEGDSACDAA